MKLKKMKAFLRFKNNCKNFFQKNMTNFSQINKFFQLRQKILPSMKSIKEEKFSMKYYMKCSKLKAKRMMYIFQKQKIFISY